MKKRIELLKDIKHAAHILYKDKENAKADLATGKKIRDDYYIDIIEQFLKEIQKYIKEQADDLHYELKRLADAYEEL